MQDLSSGNQIDNYRLDQPIANGSTACIYRGTDLRNGRHVAVKLPHLAVEADPLFYQRLLREQEIGLKLNHPSIVKFVSDEKRSRAYIVMDWIEGTSLRRILSHGAPAGLSPERALRITLNLCDALDYLHGQGVVHRDLKPENILVGDDDRITIIDFGIAGLAGARRLTFGKLSQTMGTPDYISPEQVRGKRGDARSDIYSLGIILYEMLTGATPFPADNPFAVMNLRLTNPPVPPRSVNPAISAELQEILYRALEPEPRNRYARVRELSHDLRHQDEVCLEARPAPKNPAQDDRSWFTTALRLARITLIPLSVSVVLLYAASHT